MSATTNPMLLRFHVDFNWHGAPGGLFAVASKMLGVVVGDVVEAYTGDDDPPFSYSARVTGVRETAPPSDEVILYLEIIDGTRRDWPDESAPQQGGAAPHREEPPDEAR